MPNIACGWRLVGAVSTILSIGMLSPVWADHPVPEGHHAPLKITIDPSRVAFSRAKYLPLPPEGMVTVQLIGSVIDAAFPGKAQFYLAHPDHSDVFETVSYASGEAVPLGDELEDGIAFVEPGKWYKLQVVYENPTDEDIEFYVSAPSVDPEMALPFARALCWCAAIPFNAPAHGAFARTIYVGVAAGTPPGARAIVDWPMVPIHGES